MLNKTYLRQRLYLCVIAIAFILQAFVGVTVLAETKTPKVNGPGWICGSAGQVSLQAAEEYFSEKIKVARTASYDSSRISGVLTPISQILPLIGPKKNQVSGVGAVKGSSMETQGQIKGFSSLSSTTITPEIAELARALDYDVSRITGYVLENIEFVPYFGSRKGATQTLLDGYGNDFDMCSLLIALLRESGFQADFIYATTQYYPDTLSNWFSLNVADLPQVIPEIWGSGGNPFGIVDNGGTFGGIYSKIVFVKIVIDGQNVFVSPVLRKFDHPKEPKIDIGTAMGYDRTAFFNAATSGATLGSDTVRNLNEGNINAKLTEYATNFINVLHTQYPNSDVINILGGRPKGTSSISGNFWDGVLWTEVPIEYTATLRIQHVGIDYTFSLPDIAGKRLTITYNKSNFSPELRLEGQLVASGSSTTQGSKNEAIIIINHPYPYNNGTYMDATGSDFLISGATYALVVDGGGTNNNLIKKRLKQLNLNLKNSPNDSEEVLGETLNIIGESFVKEENASAQLIANMCGEAIRIPHHRILLVKQEGGCVLNERFKGDSLISRIPGNTTHKTVYQDVSRSMGSALEHAALEQMNGSDNPAVSTVKLMALASSQGKKIFLINSQNSAVLLPQLYNYPPETITAIQATIAAGGIVVLPEDGQLNVNQWHGYGIMVELNGSSIMGISGDNFGGASSIMGLVSGLKIADKVFKIVPDNSYRLEMDNYTSEEPVDMSSGAYLYGSTDLALGREPPLGLNFQRSYNSSRASQARSMGNGWQHSNDIYLNVTSDGEPCLGSGTPVDMAGLITSSYVLTDLLEHEDNLTGWVVSFLSSKWAAERIIDNAVIINTGGQVSEYIKLPNGNYNSPPGFTATLQDNGNGTFSLKARFGTQMDFDTNGRITQLRDIDNNTLSFTYSGDKLSRVQDAVGRYFTFSYTGDNLTSVNDSQGRSVSFAYDANNNLTSFTDLAAKSWGYAYDSEHRMTSLTNPLTITTATNTYDTLGRVKTQIVPRQGPAGTSATYNFYFSGFRNVEEDPYGKRDIYYLDEKDRTHILEDALANKDTMAFDGQNHEISLKDARLNTTNFQYDGNQNLTKIIDALSKETNNTYDLQFRLTDITDPLVHTTHFDYDTKHHLLQVTDAESNTFGFNYYSNGNIETIIDGKGTQTTLTYDVNNHLQSSRLASHPAITYNYDVVGRLNSVTNQEGISDNFTYNSKGLLLTHTDPLTKVTRFVYDDAGRLTNYTDRNNQTTTYAYTPSGKLQTITYPDESTVTFTYNLHDKLISMQDALGTTTYTYDEVYRLKTITNPYGQVISYNYDAGGNVTKIIYPDNKAVTYTYDQLNRLKTVTNWLSQTATYNYDTAGRLISVTNFNGTVTEYSYDNADRLTSLQNKTESSGQIISSYTYVLDRNDNPTRITQTEPIEPIVPEENINYAYNAAKNRLLSAGLTNFTYDDEGQLITQGATSYSYDYEQRLKNISGNESVQFLYDGLGNRLQATRSGTITRYIYDADGNVLAETNSSNSITRYYIHGLGLLALVTPADQTYTYHYNGIGNTVALTDQSKNIVNKYFYTPFGELTNQVEAIPQPFKFAGESGIMSEPNGLCYIGDSYYDPAVGRFLNEAPLVAVAGINSFAFAGNNPLNPAIPALTPALYAGGNVYKASKAGDEKDGEDKEGNKGKGEKEKERKGEKPKKWDIVIGERMDRVIKAAKRLGAKFFRGKTRTGNINFVNRAKKRKATIFDIGPDFERRRHRLQRDETPWSDAYNMERKMTKDYDRVIKLWKRTGKFLGESSF